LTFIFHRQSNAFFNPVEIYESVPKKAFGLGQEFCFWYLMKYRLDRKLLSITGILLIMYSCHDVRKTSSPVLINNQIPADTITFYPLSDTGDLEILLDQVGDSRVVLLGESTHGTHDYYLWRAAITRRLVKEKGFDFIAVEGDWTDSYEINKKLNDPIADSIDWVEALKQYDRWPASMWGNYEMIPLFRWLRSNNQGQLPPGKIAYYGLDLYSFWEWTGKPSGITDTAIIRAASAVQDFFRIYNNDALKYASDTNQHAKGKTVVQKLWEAVQKFTKGKQPKEETGFRLYQQAWLTLTGEHYFRTLSADRVNAINLRDGYMAGTIRRLMDFHGPGSKAVIWAHNGHAGDARYSAMHDAGYTSVAEILAKELGRQNIFCIGFGTYKGTVLAGYSWNAPLIVQEVPAAKAGSWEYLLHIQSAENKIILSKDIRDNRNFDKWIEFRSIGATFSGAAIYNLSIMPRRFDAFVFIDSTTALHPVLERTPSR
jgi:erythromycin esterase-like protein